MPFTRFKVSDFHLGLWMAAFDWVEVGMSHPQAATSLWACMRPVIPLFRHSAKLIED